MTDQGTRGAGRWKRRLASVTTLVPAWLAAGPALAQDTSAGLASFGVSDVIQYSIFTGMLGAAMVSAFWVIRERARVSDENRTLRLKISDLNAALQRNESLLNLKDQRLIVWSDPQASAELVGSLPAECGAPDDRPSFLAFGRWLSSTSAQELERAIIALRDRDVPFSMVCQTRSGSLLEADGRIAPHHTVVRFTSLSEGRAEHARLKLDFQTMMAEFETLRHLAAIVHTPMWLRDNEGRLSWVNDAYARAVDADSSEQAVAEQRELLPTVAREQILRHQMQDQTFASRLSTVIGKERHQFLVTDWRGTAGSAGIAVDVTGQELLREEYDHAQRSHADTLDQLNTAVAIFDADQHLRFYNLAFQKLWDLDTAFLSSAPSHTLLLDRLRSDGVLAEQPEWRRWKEQLLGAYRAVDSQEHWWHLPDGRTLRVVANPQPKGGVTWVFENLTEKIDLESRYKTAIRVQGETLDNLAEGVAVFGPDGRVRLCNPAFAELWSLPDELAQENVHISAIRGACDVIARTSPWPDFVSLATGFDETRDERKGRTELTDGTILSWAAMPLPNGQLMTTFVDMTDTFNVERALKDKNEALQRADQIKDEFIQHVSYELRSPLTNIIGFTELLSMGTPGPLTGKQREYVDHIATSSSALLTIVNDILDLATVDAGIMELDIADMNVAETVQAAADLSADRFAEQGIALTIRLDSAPATLPADANRVRQVLFNLLANAANFAPAGSTVSLEVAERGNQVAFIVHDDGPGMSAEILDQVFRRFSSTGGGRRRGAGLGLSIVKSFVELHGGSVDIASAPEKGTTVTCLFPLRRDDLQDAAE
ncbi:alkaline phosphatase [Zhengella mangrovi]|uniref:histidine kinase n=1 Tax=Zhengella mangrovi TaxID=1982044 RepID=A0A2G1QU15_9HYPH|nr:PAS domain-containing sensor histidine kinase [Zhengella mangrovi]PHP68959.1 alkaline phosphatase [Zhengella mangrovi]